MKILSLLRKKETPAFMIDIPEPCSEDWNRMNVIDDLHRHCDACERTLVDFSVMSDDELVIFFKHNKGKVCGRFRKDQTNRSLTNLPEKTSKANWWKAAMLLPLTLFSKNSEAQIVADSTITEQQVPDVSVDTIEPASIDVDWGYPLDTGQYKWDWNFGDNPAPSSVTIAAAPMVLTGWTVCVTTENIAPVQNLIPATGSFIGVQANSTAPKEIPNVAEAARFAGSLHRSTLKKEE